MSDDKDDDEIKNEDVITFQRSDYAFIKLKNKTQYMGKVNIQIEEDIYFLMIYDPIEIGYELDPEFEEPMMYFMYPLFATKQDVLPIEMTDIEFFGEMNDVYHEMYVQHTGLEMDVSDMKIEKEPDDTPEPTKRKGNVFYLGRKKKD